jgi:hypothetical protein
MTTDPTEHSDSPRMRRSSRYARAQQRRAAQKAADNKFYGGMFALIGVVVMAALLIAALAINGRQVDVSGLESWTRPWLLGMSKLEVGAFVLAAIMATVIYSRMRRKK